MDNIQYENCLDAIRELLEKNRSKTKMLLPEAFDRLMNDASEMEATIGVLIADDERAAATIARLTDENERLREVLKLISVANQGCGGNLTHREIAESTMRQAEAALAAAEHAREGGKVRP